MGNRKMTGPHRCRGIPLGVYIQRQDVDWLKVGRAMGETKTLTQERIHALKTTVMEQFVTNQGRRLGCGFDVTTLMEEVPWDGQQHFVECPKCGQKCGIRHEALDPIKE